MIKFEFEDNSLTFDDVAEGQFFENIGGRLCQRFNRDQYFIIADERGIPCAVVVRDVGSDEPINAILPHVKRITWK